MNPLQERLLTILKAFIAVCEKHNLKYFLMGGTALGAVRHKGFIPWDDDIDVGMPREDYDKFMTLQYEYEGTPYFIQNYKTDPCYIYGFAKLRDSSATYIENFYKNHRINHGLWIDIFPFDGMSRKMVPAKKLGRKVWHVYFQSFFAYLPALRRKVRKKTWFKDILLNIVAGLFYILDIAHFRNKVAEKYAKKIPLNESVLAGNLFGFNMKKEAMPTKIFQEFIKVPFENIEAMIMKDYDAYLTYLYGDYMKLPPEEKRVGHHHNSGFSLEIGYEQYMDEHRI